jgi:electron transfer flavoprotein alpha subunit
MPTIVTFAEHREGRLRRPSLETLSEARRLADALGATVQTVLVGSGIAALAGEAGAYGADRVHVFDQAEFSAYATEPWARVVAKVIADEKATAALVPSTAMGRDLAPRVAARVGAGLASDCVALAARDGRLEARRPMYAGKVFATVGWEGDPQMATLRPNVFPLGPRQDGRAFETVTGAPDDTTARARVVRVEATAAGKVELTEAQVIVSGGRGLKGPENFHLVEDLAQALGGAAGASRAIVDAGWVDHQLQVGQTGKTVSPTLYVAAGISGAIQHLAGMSSSKVVVAINKDPDAPIFKAASYGIVGDLFEVLPRLTEAAKRLRAGRT